MLTLICYANFSANVLYGHKIGLYQHVGTVHLINYLQAVPICNIDNHINISYENVGHCYLHSRGKLALDQGEFCFPDIKVCVSRRE